MCLISKRKLEAPFTPLDEDASTGSNNLVTTSSESIIRVKQEIIDSNNYTNSSTPLKKECDVGSFNVVAGSIIKTEIDQPSDSEDTCQYALVEIVEQSDGATPQGSEHVAEDSELIEKACRNIPLLAQKKFKPDRFLCNVQIKPIEENHLNQLSDGNSIVCYSCSVCSEVIFNNSESIHTCEQCKDTRPLPCNRKKRATPKGNRKKGRRKRFRWTSVKRHACTVVYTCKFCHNRFVVRSLFFAHLKIHKSKSNEKSTPLSQTTVESALSTTTSPQTAKIAQYCAKKEKLNSSRRLKVLHSGDVVYGSKINCYYVKLITTKFRKLSIRQEWRRAQQSEMPKLVPETRKPKLGIHTKNTSMPVLLPAITSIEPRTKSEFLQQSVLHVQRTQPIFKANEEKSPNKSFGISVIPSFPLLNDSSKGYSDQSFVTETELGLNMSAYIISLLEQTNSHQTRAAYQSTFNIKQETFSGIIQHTDSANVSVESLHPYKNSDFNTWSTNSRDRTVFLFSKQCYYCDANFTCSDLYKLHIENYHTGCNVLELNITSLNNKEDVDTTVKACTYEEDTQDSEEGIQGLLVCDEVMKYTAVKDLGSEIESVKGNFGISNETLEARAKDVYSYIGSSQEPPKCNVSSSGKISKSVAELRKTNARSFSNLFEVRTQLVKSNVSKTLKARTELVESDVNSHTEMSEATTDSAHDVFGSNSKTIEKTNIVLFPIESAEEDSDVNPHTEMCEATTDSTHDVFGPNSDTIEKTNTVPSPIETAEEGSNTSILAELQLEEDNIVPQINKTTSQVSLNINEDRKTSKLKNRKHVVAIPYLKKKKSEILVMDSDIAYQQNSTVPVLSLEPARGERGEHETTFQAASSEFLTPKEWNRVHQVCLQQALVLPESSSDNTSTVSALPTTPNIIKEAKPSNNEQLMCVVDNALVENVNQNESNHETIAPNIESVQKTIVEKQNTAQYQSVNSKLLDVNNSLNQNQSILVSAKEAVIQPLDIALAANPLPNECKKTANCKRDCVCTNDLIAQSQTDSFRGYKTEELISAEQMIRREDKILKPFKIALKGIVENAAELPAQNQTVSEKPLLALTSLNVTSCQRIHETANIFDVLPKYVESTYSDGNSKSPVLETTQPLQNAEVSNSDSAIYYQRRNGDKYFSRNREISLHTFESSKKPVGINVESLVHTKNDWNSETNQTLSQNSETTTKLEQPVCVNIANTSQEIYDSIESSDPIMPDLQNIKIELYLDSDRETEENALTDNSEKIATETDNKSQDTFTSEVAEISRGTKRKRAESSSETKTAPQDVVNNDSDIDSAESFELRLQLSDSESETCEPTGVEENILEQTSHRKSIKNVKYKRKRVTKTRFTLRKRSSKNTKAIQETGVLQDSKDEEVVSNKDKHNVEKCRTFYCAECALRAIEEEENKLGCAPTAANKRLFDSKPCEECSLMFKKGFWMKAHLDNYHIANKRPKSSNCNLLDLYCKSVISKANDLPTTVQCPRCSKYFYEDYFNNMHKQIPECSDPCGETTEKSDTTDINRRNVRNYSCKVCDTSYKHVFSLKVHSLIHKYDDSTSSSSHSDIADLKNEIEGMMERIEALKNFQCEQCNMSFVSKADLRMHCAFKHGS